MPVKRLNSWFPPFFKAQFALSMDVALTVVVGLSSPFVKGERGGFDPVSVRASLGEIPPLPPLQRGEPYFLANSAHHSLTRTEPLKKRGEGGFHGARCIHRRHKSPRSPFFKGGSNPPPAPASISSSNANRAFFKEENPVRNRFTKRFPTCPGRRISRAIKALKLIFQPAFRPVGRPVFPCTDKSRE
jgi:hypothetical protein